MHRDASVKTTEIPRRTSAYLPERPAVSRVWWGAGWVVCGIYVVFTDAVRRCRLLQWVPVRIVVWFAVVVEVLGCVGAELRSSDVYRQRGRGVWVVSIPARLGRGSPDGPGRGWVIWSRGDAGPWV